MTTDKTEAPAKKTSPGNVKTKKAAMPAVKPAAKEIKSSPEPAPKTSKKPPEVKKVRDTFSMPQAEHQKIAEIKEKCLEAGLQVKKSHVLRAGLKALLGMNEAQLKHAIAQLKKTKPVRSKKP